MNTFDYPIGVLMFNRPHLAKFVLKSLRNSSIPINEELLVFHLDGYSGSKFEMQLERDRTREVEVLVKKSFPKSHIIKQEKNIGIARSFFVVMDYIFNKFESDFAIFQEEDTFLAPHYFQLMASILYEIKDSTWVGAISINNQDHYQSITNNFVIPTYGTREMAFSRQVFLDSKDIYQTYLDSLGDSYRSKNLEVVNRALAKFGIQSRSPMQDVFQHELLRWHKKLHLRINVPGSFQANFSGGESIPGLGISALITEFLKNLRNRNVLNDPILRDFKLSELNLSELQILEDELWKSRKSSPSQSPMSPLGNKLILLRNRLGLSRLKFIMETIIISNALRGNRFFQSRST